MKFVGMIVAVALASISAGQEFTYQKPPAAITSVMETPRIPLLSVSPAMDYALLTQRERYLGVADLALPMVPLAGIRVNPRNDAIARQLPISALTLMRLSDGSTRKVDLIPNARALETDWAPDGKRFAVLFAFPDRVQVAIGETATGKLKLLKPNIAGCYGTPIRWMPDSRTLLIRESGTSMRPAPARPESPAGPEIQQSLGAKTPARTLPDALRDSFAEQQFDYYMSAQLSLVNAVSGSAIHLDAGILNATPSPDGKKLLVESLDRPFSRKVYAPGFPKTFTVYDLKSNTQSPLVKQAGEEGTPIDGVVTGPREIRWRSDTPETVIWVEALDGGDPKAKAEHRDRIIADDLTHPGPAELLKVRNRFEGLDWAESGSQAILTEYNFDRERITRSLVTFNKGTAQSQAISEFDEREQYANPGNFLIKESLNGHNVLLQDGDWAYLSGEGASPKGDHPFLDRLNLVTLKTERLWQCDDDHFESLDRLISTKPLTFVTLRESPTEYPNYVLHDASAGHALTNFVNPHPELLGITKTLVKYKRADGVDLSFTLFLPPGATPGAKLPAIVEAYPLEFTDASTAGQVVGSTKTFPSLRGDLLFLLAGYAVMDNVAMPIVGKPQTVNDTFVDQLASDAAAAVKAADQTGSVDTSRIGVMGHSYGAFMTANLLAHTDFFKAGAAESGAYNRTLTPFGFQSERRTFWEAPQMYLAVSPFAYADKIKHPILLIHGLQDDNPGTYTIQSERLFQALSGNGAIARLVLLPYEAHGYVAKETLEHVIWEELTWFDKYVKG